MEPAAADRTAHHQDEPAQLIFPLTARPSRRRVWMRRTVAAVLVGLLVAGLVITASQLRGARSGEDPAGMSAAAAEPSGGTSPQRGYQASVFELGPGDCLADLGAARAARLVPVVPCDVPHRAEVVAVVQLPDRPWPGAAEVQDLATDRCVAAIRSTGIRAEAGLRWTYFGPSEDSWTTGADRAVSCLVVGSDAPLVGSLLEGTGG
jgi:hypothetical protein